MNLVDVTVGMTLTVDEPGESRQMGQVINVRLEDNRQLYGVCMKYATWNGVWLRSTWCSKTITKDEA